MIIGIYCILGGLLIIAGWLFFPAMHEKRGRFLLLTTLSLLAGLILFELASALLGISRLGEPMQYSYPQDYLVRGLPGWLAMLLPIHFLISPLFIAAWFSGKARGEVNRS